MKIAIITTDNREAWKKYALPQPILGIAPEVLLQGFTELGDIIEIHIICCTKKPVSSPLMLANNIYYHSVMIPSWGMMKSLYWGAVRAIRKKLMDIHPDIVHGQGTEREAALAAVFSGYPNVVTIHGNMRKIAKLRHARLGSFYWLAARLEALALKKAHGVICITKYTEKLVKPLTNKTWIIPNATDNRYFDVKRKRPSNKKILLCVGLIYEIKNQNQLIQTLDSLHKEHEFELRFLGSVSKETSYGRDFLSLIQTRPWCQLAGLVNRDELARELGGAYGLILPSIEDNCPLVILEAMAAGVPVAASAVGGIPELIEHGKTGWLFNPHIRDSIKKVLNYFLVEEKIINDVAIRAKNEAVKRFNAKTIAQKHVEIYQEILNSQ
jgi:glycosyltransferase involved in cell wall biosynthesis